MTASFFGSRLALILGGAIGCYAVMTWGAPGVLMSLGLNGLILVHQTFGRLP